MRNVLLACLATLGVASANSLDRGLHAMIAGDYQVAETELAQAAHERPSDAMVRFNYASALRELGKNDAAICEYQAVLGLPSDRTTHANALYGIALSRDAQRDPVASSQAWHDYLAFAGNDANETAAEQIARDNLTRARREASIPRVVR